MYRTCFLCSSHATCRVSTACRQCRKSECQACEACPKQTYLHMLTLGVKTCDLPCCTAEWWAEHRDPVTVHGDISAPRHLSEGFGKGAPSDRCIVLVPYLTGLHAPGAASADPGLPPWRALDLSVQRSTLLLFMGGTRGGTRTKMLQIFQKANEDVQRPVGYARSFALEEVEGSAEEVSKQGAAFYRRSWELCTPPAQLPTSRNALPSGASLLRHVLLGGADADLNNELEEMRTQVGEMASKVEGMCKRVGGLENKLDTVIELLGKKA